MRGQQHSGALLVELGNELPQRLPQLHIDTSSRLIQHNDGRLVHQSLCYQHAALHTARELAHIRILLVGQAQAVQQLINPSLIVFHAEIARLNAQRFAHAEKGVEHQFLRYDA